MLAISACRRKDIECLSVQNLWIITNPCSGLLYQSLTWACGKRQTTKITKSAKAPRFWLNSTAGSHSPHLFIVIKNTSQVADSPSARATPLMVSFGVAHFGQTHQSRHNARILNSHYGELCIYSRNRILIYGPLNVAFKKGTLLVT